jgi:hypothetical protein
MKKLLLFLSILLLLLISPFVHAANETSYSITWWTVDSGGISTGGDFRLYGTAGQADAGLMQGGDFTLQGGFWSGGGGPQDYRTFLPLTVRQ